MLLTTVLGSYAKSSSVVRVNSTLPIYSISRAPDQLWRSRGECDDEKNVLIFDLGPQPSVGREENGCYPARAWRDREVEPVAGGVVE